MIRLSVPVDIGILGIQVWQVAGETTALDVSDAAALWAGLFLGAVLPGLNCPKWGYSYLRPLF